MRNSPIFPLTLDEFQKLAARTAGAATAVAALGGHVDGAVIIGFVETPITEDFIPVAVDIERLVARLDTHHDYGVSGCRLPTLLIVSRVVVVSEAVVDGFVRLDLVLDILSEPDPLIEIEVEVITFLVVDDVVCRAFDVIEDPPGPTATVAIESARSVEIVAEVPK